MVDLNSPDFTPAEQKESVKLVKMSKGYNWELKLVGSPNIDEATLNRLERLNNELHLKYGNQD